jgi:hypothetical protein
MAAALLDSGAFSDLLSPVQRRMARALYNYDSARTYYTRPSFTCGTGTPRRRRSPFINARTKVRLPTSTAAQKRVAEQIHAFEN